MALLDVERREHIAVVTINRPEKRNALGEVGDGDAFTSLFDQLNEDAGICCVILTGAGNAFSAGGDIKSMHERSGAFGGTPVELRDGYRRGIHAIARALHGLDVPLIAAVNGPAIGFGCDLACLADIRIASDRAQFGVTFLKLGLVPGDGGAWLLPRVLGLSRAAELLFTGDVIEARIAAEWGLVSRIVAHDRLLEESMAVATKIAAMPSHALRLTKRMMRQGLTSSYEAALDLAASTQALLHLTVDHRERLDAVIKMRNAKLSGT